MMTVIAVIFCIWFGSMVCYMLAIMPRMFKRPDREPFLHVLYAHRGLHDNDTDAPENSMRAFEKAVEAGYGIELDIQLSKDGVPVVFHDFTLKRVCEAEGKICDYTYEELQRFRLCRTGEKIPRLDEVLRLVNGKVPLIVEFKVEWRELALCSPADELLREYKGAYCIESFNPLVLLWYRRHNKSVMRGQLSDSFEKGGEGVHSFLLYRALENLLFNFVTKPDFIAYNHKFYRNRARCICRYVYGGLAAAWTVKSQEELDARRDDFDLFIFDSFIPGEDDQTKILQKSLLEQTFGRETIDVERVKQIVSQIDRISVQENTEKFNREEVWERITESCREELESGELMERLPENAFHKKKLQHHKFIPVAILAVTVFTAICIGNNLGIYAAGKKNLQPDYEEFTVYSLEDLPEQYKEEIIMSCQIPEVLMLDSIKVWDGDLVSGYRIRYLDAEAEKWMNIETAQGMILEGPEGKYARRFQYKGRWYSLCGSFPIEK